VKISKISNLFFFFSPSGENLPKKESLLRSLWGRSLCPKTRDDGKAKMRDDGKAKWSSCVNRARDPKGWVRSFSYKNPIHT